MTIDELKLKLENLRNKQNRIAAEIETTENALAEMSCPWRGGTVLEHKTSGARFIVDVVYWASNEWATRVVNIRSDGNFGSRESRIYARDRQNYRVLAGFTVTDTGIKKGPSVDEKIKNWWS